MEKQSYYVDRRLAPAMGARYWRLLGPLSESSRVLDVGCGAGDLGRYKPEGIHVFGIDHDIGAVRGASRFETTQSVDLERSQLPFPDGYFSGAFAKDILEHVTQPNKLLAEIHRVLAPRARLLVSVPMEFPWVVWNDYTHQRGFTRSALSMMLRDCQFDDIQIFPMGGVPGASRLGLVDQLPNFLRIPGMRLLFGRSWEACALRRESKSESPVNIPTNTL